MYLMFMSKASQKLKMVILHLWQINVKTTGGFINIQIENFHMVKPRHNNITNCILYNHRM
jgi:hypothetical protein